MIKNKKKQKNKKAIKLQKKIKNEKLRQLYTKQEKKRPTSLCDGIVYVMKTKFGHYKIGYTSRLNIRMEELPVQYNTSFEFVFGLQTHSCLKLEYDLHKTFERKRVMGYNTGGHASNEFFALNDMDLEMIKGIKNYDGKPAFPILSL